MQDAYIYDGIRTPIGRYAGALSGVRPDDLLARLLSHLVERNAFESKSYEDVIIGCTNQAGEDARNVARMASLAARLPITLGGQTVNRLCGSGMAAIIDAARAICCGEGQLFLAGGVESMSRAPLVLNKSEDPFSRNVTLFDSTIGARFPNPEVLRVFGGDSMPQTADNVARELGISRAACDEWALASQQRYTAAVERGFYRGEVLPISVPQRRRQPSIEVSEDEHPRPRTRLEDLSRLPALEEGGVVTAGNASGVNDGAAALVLGSREAGERVGAVPRARLVASAVAGVEPRLMGLGPVPAVRKALERAGLGLEDMDAIELNEAFAAQVLGCLQQLRLKATDSRVNPNGGAIAIGHPLGASGARITLTTLRQLEQGGGRYGLATMCIGLGQGIAMVMERIG